MAKVRNIQSVRMQGLQPKGHKVLMNLSFTNSQKLIFLSKELRCILYFIVILTQKSITLSRLAARDSDHNAKCLI